MIPQRVGIGAVLAMVILLGGCLMGRSGGPAFGTTEREDAVKIFVTNLAFTDATLYAVTTGMRQRLGRITGKRESVFTLPLPFPTEMHLEIDLLAGPTCYTDRVTVDPGDELELTIQNDGANLYCGAT